MEEGKVKRLSGGSLNYFYAELEEHVGDFDDKELDSLVSDLAKLFHDREWCLSGDTGKGDWVESKLAFKRKWFTSQGQQDRIEQYLREFTDEIRETFLLKAEYCQKCEHWTPAKEYNDPRKYGRCKYVKGCVMHRYESCEKYKRK